MQTLLHRILAVTALSVLAAFVLFTQAYAADKTGVGGNCCSDLEERIAELEATTAKKGNRKVRLTVSGSVNQAFLYTDVDGETNTKVLNNSTTGTYLRFAGTANFSKDLYAGFVIEIGQEELGIVGDALTANSSNGVDLRRSAVWIQAPLGKLTLGKDSEATDGVVDGTSVANTAPATRMLSFRPLLGGDGLTENLDVYDGQRLNILRYDTPTMAGFTASASWSADGTDNALGDVTDVYGIALRYFGEFQEVKVAGAVGYRKGAVFPGLDPLLNIGQAAIDQETISGSGSVMHAPSGLFLNVAGGQATFFGGPKITSWEVMPGIEARLNKLGKTTFFVNYSQWKLDGSDEELSYYGGGVVQAFDGAALSLYVTARVIDIDGEEVQYGLAGMKLDF